MYNIVQKVSGKILQYSTHAKQNSVKVIDDNSLIFIQHNC